MNPFQTELARVLSYIAEAEMKKGEESATLLSSARIGLVHISQSVSSLLPGEGRAQFFHTLTVRALVHLDSGQLERALATVNLLRDLSIG